MKKILLIISREYLTRVKKKSFIIMTIIGPVLMASLFIVPVIISKVSENVKTIGIVDDSKLFYQKFQDTDNIKFVYLDKNIIQAKKEFYENKQYAILYIPEIIINSPSSAMLFSDKQPSINIKSTLENIIKKEIESLKLNACGIDQGVLSSVKTDISLTTIKLTEGGKEEKTYSELCAILGYIGGFLIYMFIFMYGVQVMRGVIEEKTNRIVEIIISSVKPFQLMAGKITGVAFVGLTQFLLWVLLTFVLTTTIKSAFPEVFTSKKHEQVYSQKNEKMLNVKQLEQMAKERQKEKEDDSVSKIFESINSINFGVVIGTFLFFFLGGYLLYASLFAAVGSAVDNETDTQQFMLPITIPLIFSLVLLPMLVFDNPESPVAFWLSMIPFTSPIIMMARIPFGVPYYEVWLSALFLILGFLGTTWLAAKIYRTGILMYGKKVNYRELWKWLTYKG